MCVGPAGMDAGASNAYSLASIARSWPAPAADPDAAADADADGDSDVDGDVDPLAEAAGDPTLGDDDDTVCPEQPDRSASVTMRMPRVAADRPVRERATTIDVYLPKVVIVSGGWLSGR